MNDWIIDVSNKEARHVSGLTLAFKGAPGTDHFSASLRQYSKAMQPLELSRLIREGFAEYETAASHAYLEKASVSDFLGAQDLSLWGERNSSGPLASSSSQFH